MTKNNTRYKVSHGTDCTSTESDSEIDSDYIPPEEEESEEESEEEESEEDIGDIIVKALKSYSSSHGKRKRRRQRKTRERRVEIIPYRRKSSASQNDLVELDGSKFKASLNKINSISDMIKVATEWKVYKLGFGRSKSAPTYTEIEYDKLASIIPQLRKLDDMIGMNEIKTTLANQILYFIQSLHGKEMMNLVLTGYPGTGKSTVGEILGQIYKNIGILSKGTFHLARRTDFIADYMGQTANKTLTFLKQCLGGVIFIDEAYSIGRSDADGDSYAQECVNTLNQFLSENRDIICILAGYEENIKRDFFSLNQGLERRFPWRFNINKYTSTELRDIFMYRMKTDNWDLGFEMTKLDPFFSQHYSKFTNSGGDCEILLNKCKIEHGKRIFYLPEEEKKKQRFKLSISDFKNGLTQFISNKRVVNDHYHMYI